MLVIFLIFFKIYILFFSTSTCRWEILSASVKELSTTRWSAREDACKSLNNNWDRVINALTEIKGNDKQKAQTRCEANGILKNLACFENVFMSIFWGDLLQRFNVVSKMLQSIDIDLNVVVELYESLIHYISDLRNERMFKIYEDQASKLRAVGSAYKLDIQRRKKRKISYDELRQDEPYFCGRKHFLINTYYVILDNLYTELIKRKEVYDNLTSKYSFFFKSNYVIRIRHF